MPFPQPFVQIVDLENRNHRISETVREKKCVSPFRPIMETSLVLKFGLADTNPGPSCCSP